MKRLLCILTLFILLGCSKEEETRIFTVTVNAIPLEGGTVTLETTQLTKDEYLWGDTANINAYSSEGYEFSHWTANTFITGLVQDGNPGAANNKTYTSIELRCLDSTNCTYDIIITGHFVKKN
mgnify:FL=1